MHKNASNLDRIKGGRRTFTPLHGKTCSHRRRKNTSQQECLARKVTDCFLSNSSDAAFFRCQIYLDCLVALLTKIWHLQCFCEHERKKHREPFGFLRFHSGPGACSCFGQFIQVFRPVQRKTKGSCTAPS